MCLQILKDQRAGTDRVTTGKSNHLHILSDHTWYNFENWFNRSRTELQIQNLNSMHLPELDTIACFIIVVHLLHSSLYSISVSKIFNAERLYIKLIC